MMNLKNKRMLLMSLFVIVSLLLINTSALGATSSDSGVILSLNTTEPTNNDVTVDVSLANGQDIDYITMIGEDIVRDSEFEQGGRHWDAGHNGGIVRIENGRVYLDDNDAHTNKLRQLNSFTDSVVGATYYAEVVARGRGELNARYAYSGGGGSQQNYSIDIDEEDEFQTYRFLLSRWENSIDHLHVERRGYEGWIEIDSVKVFPEIEVVNESINIQDNGEYTFVVEDTSGNVMSETIEIDNIDKTMPELNLNVNNTEWTNEEVTIEVDAVDHDSGIRSVMYIGENMIANHDFRDGYDKWTNHWWSRDGDLREGEFILTGDQTMMLDSQVTSNKIKQDHAFMGSSMGSEYYAEIIARGTGRLNSRYGAAAGHQQHDYVASMNSETEFQTYRFLMRRFENSSNQLVVEKLSPNDWVEIKEIKAFAENDITDTRELVVTENGEYTFVVEDHAGNIVSDSITINHIDNEAPSSPVINTANGWQDSEVLIDIVPGNDDLSGVSHVEYRLNNGSWTTFEENTVIDSNGVFNLDARTVDNAGNVSDIASEVIEIDLDGPEISVDYDDSWTSDDVVINIDVFDEHSGVENVMLTGENLIKNGYFNDGFAHWEGEHVGKTGGIVDIFDGSAWFTDNSIESNKLIQRDVFTDSVLGATYYSEIDARGSGILNARFAYSNGHPQRDYVANINNEDEFETYRFLMSRFEQSSDNFIIEKVNDGHIEIDNVRVFPEIEVEDNQVIVSENGTYTIVAEDKVGNITTKEVEINNIDREGPEITLTPSTNEITHDNIFIEVDAEDSQSGVDTVTMIGEDMVNDGSFEHGYDYWTYGPTGGYVDVSNGIALFDDDSMKTNKLVQERAFRDTVVGASYYAEVSASGDGILNVRYSTDGTSSCFQQENYATHLNNTTEFNTYKFFLERFDCSATSLILEKRDNGRIEVDNIKVYPEIEVIDNQVEVTQNGTYTFIATDNVGNISERQITIDNIDKTISFEAPEIGELSNIVLNEDVNQSTANVSPVIVKDWRDDSNSWRVNVSATKPTTEDGLLLNGVMKLNPLTTINRLEGSGETPDNSLTSPTAIDDGKVEIARSENSRGAFELVFPEDAFEISIDSSLAKIGTYESTITWELVKAP